VYVAPQNLYFRFKGISEFMKGFHHYSTEMIIVEKGRISLSLSLSHTHTLLHVQVNS